VTGQCLNNKHNVFFVAEKACRNLAVLIISNCDSIGKKLKFFLTFPDSRGRPSPKNCYKEAIYSKFKRLPVTWEQRACFCVV